MKPCLRIRDREAMKHQIKEIEDYLPTISETLKTWDSVSRKMYLLRYYYIERFFAEEHLRVILDVGCGDGLLLNFLSKVDESDVYVGVDFSLSNILYAHKKVKVSKKNWREAYFILADAEYLPLRARCVNAVVLTEVLEHLPVSYSALLESERVLMEDGKVMVTTPSAFKLRGGPLGRMKNLILCLADKKPKRRETSLKIRGKTLPHRDFTRSELKDLLKGFFQIAKLRSISFNYIYAIFKRLLPTESVSRLIYYVDMAMSGIPFFGVSGYYWLVTGQKHKYHRDDFC